MVIVAVKLHSAVKSYITIRILQVHTLIFVNDLTQTAQNGFRILNAVESWTVSSRSSSSSPYSTNLSRVSEEAIDLKVSQN